MVKNMTSWQRPPGPINVWNVVDGYEKLKDGTKKPVKFSIQDVPNTEEREKEVYDLLCSNFLVEETFCRSLKIKDDPQGIEDFKKIWKYGFDQGVAVGCYKLDPEGKIDKLVGVNSVYIATDQTAKDFNELKKTFGSNFLKIWNVYEMLTKNIDIKKMYNTDKYISSISLSVLPAYRGQKLGCYILNARNALGKKYGFTATSTMFTAEASQIQAARDGFEVANSIDYADLVDDKGKPLFPNATPKSTKIMTKRLS